MQWVDAQGRHSLSFPTAPVELLVRVALDASQVFYERRTLYCWRRICMLSKPPLDKK